MKKTKSTRPVKLNMTTKPLFRFKQPKNRINDQEPFDYAAGNAPVDTSWGKPDDFFT